MTKREYHKKINKLFYTYVNSNFPQYELDFNESGGKVYLIPGNKKNSINNHYDLIEYHQSQHSLCCYNWSYKQTKGIIKTMEKYLTNIIIPFVDTLYEN